MIRRLGLLTMALVLAAAAPSQAAPGAKRSSATKKAGTNARPGKPKAKTGVQKSKNKKSTVGKKPGKKRAAYDPPVPKAYRAAVKGWHSSAGAPRLGSNGLPLLVLVALNTGERVELQPQTDQGGFSARALDEAAWLLREVGSGRTHPVEPLTLDTLYRVQRHFEAPLLRVISGYRAPKSNGRASNHGRGRAVDFVVPGASDKDVAELARSYGYKGVGIYPKSGFVHVDVRDRSYFWVDTSGPGRRHRERGILGGQAQSADQQAKLRGERAPLPYGVHPSKVDDHTDDEDEDDDDASDDES